MPRAFLLPSSVLLGFFLAGLGSASAQNYVPLQTEQAEKYQWLEDVSSPRSMDWVKAENARSAAVLEADPRYATMRDEALKILESPTRLPTPDQRGTMIYNQWQDAQHVRGILRRTTEADYLSAEPHWQTVIDYDALGKADDVKWVGHGIDCLYPGDRICLASLSAGGEDAVTMREIDLKSGQFVAGGFVLPKSKQDVTWEDADTLLVSRDWGPGTMTRSGYPFVIKRWKRGAPLESAVEVYRGTQDDISTGAFSLHDPQGHKAVMISRGLNFFEAEYFLLNATGTAKLGLPKKCGIQGLLDGHLIVMLNEPWTPEGASKTYAQGAVVSLDLDQVKKDPIHLKPTVIFEPTAQEFAQDVSVTPGRMLLTTLDHVQGRAYLYTVSKVGAWTRKPLPVPENTTISVLSTSTSNETFFLGLTGFLTPSSILRGDAATGKLTLAKSLPAQFDASNLRVEQLQATSTDGTKIPYFVAHRKDIAYNGQNPTLMTAYGGFQASMTPYYSGVTGKLWLEHGGVYVLANIRGGGEFGPAWHEAGLKTHRQIIYDDFASVAKDLFARKITTPRRMGIVGGSNGGLLMGVEMTQHPELWNAVVIQVPLLDMLRFEQIAAGASWVGEYGSVSNPEERRFLASISPYNQLRPEVTYPEPLIFTTTKDDRVGPVHARKFAARMEEFHKPFFYQEITEGGHGAGADLKEKAGTSATEFLYLTRKLMD